MADVRVRNVLTESEQPSGRSWPVEVVLNNNETVALVTNPKTCNPDGIGARGHKTDVTLELRDQAGNVVWNSTKPEVCVPVTEPSTLLSGNKRVTFMPDVDAGLEGETVTLHASASVVREDRTHSHSPVGVSITGVDDTQAPSDPSPGGGGGGTDYSDLFPDSSPNGGEPFGVPVDKILLVIGLFAVAMIARSGSEILGG